MSQQLESSHEKSTVLKVCLIRSLEYTNLQLNVIIKFRTFDKEKIKFCSFSPNILNNLNMTQYPLTYVQFIYKTSAFAHARNIRNVHVNITKL